MKKSLASFFAALYEKILHWSQKFYRSSPGRIRKVGARVVSVGNITWGGTGKTPLVIALARQLSEDGKRVAVLIRGYGRDEVEELHKAIPDVTVLVGRDRVKTAREAVEKHKAEIIILDDGFQHIRLHRDVDIVNINATLPFGPGGLIPLGTLREPLQNLNRAGVFVLTKSDIGSKNLPWIRQKLLSIKPDAVIFEAVHRPVRFLDFKRNRFVQLEEVRGRKVATLSGIGDPYSFERMIEKMGADILLAARFNDHHCYTQAELADFANRCREVGVKDVMTTRKDYFRIEPLLKKKKSAGTGLNFWVLEVEFQVDDEEDFIRRCLHS